MKYRIHRKEIFYVAKDELIGGMIMKTRIGSFISILIACSLLFSSVIPVLAVSPVENTVVFPEQTSVGLLTSDTGEQIQILGTKISSCQRSADMSTVDTYKFVIPDSVMRDSGLTKYGPDNGYSSTIYLSIYYVGAQQYLLTGVSGYWEMSDPRASVESAFLSYGCTPYSIGPAHDQHVENLPVSNYFSCTTGFTHYIPEMGGVLGAYLVLNYLMGTSRRWTFTFNNYLFNNSVV